MRPSDHALHSQATLKKLLLSNTARKTKQLVTDVIVNTHPSVCVLCVYILILPFETLDDVS